MNKYIYKANGKAMHEDIKYWCNCCGELHNHGDYTITEDELPQELKGAFKDLWTDKYGSLCCLIETPNGYGIALINEYDPCYADDCRMSMDDLFISLLSDVNMISERDEFMRADIYLGESISVDDCHGLVIHELIVVLPCDISIDEFTKAAVLLDELVYQSAKKM